MTSVLFALAAGLPERTIAGVIPPACRAGVGLAPGSAAGAASDEPLIEGPDWPAMGATHFVPSFTALTSSPYSVRLELSARVGGAWTPWVAGVSLGPDPFAPLSPAESLDVDVDVVRARAPVEAVRVRARLRGPAVAAVPEAPWLLTLSSSTGDRSRVVGGGAEDSAVRLEVPALSQRDADPAIAARICSPTCVAMVLRFWGRVAPLADLAAEIFHSGVNLYGVWPAAIRAAGRHGVAGYLLRFPDWPAAAWCLGRGLPVIASLRYGPGELRGAAVAETPGHLVVLTGWAGEDALVNDPAAPAPSVSRRYRLEDLTRVWLERSAVGYVLFPPG